MGRFQNLELESTEGFSDLEGPPVKKDEKYYVALGDARMREGRFENALRFYSRALEFDARQANAWLGQVLALLELDEPEEARVWAGKGLESFRDHGDLLAAKGVAAARTGDVSGGMALSDASLAEKGASAFRWRARGEVLLLDGDRREEHCFGKALTAAPGDWYEPLCIARAYRRYSHEAPAHRWLTTALERQRSSAHLWETTAACREALGMLGGALDAWRHALDLDRGSMTARAGVERLQSEGVWAAVRRAWGGLWRSQA